MKLKADIKKDLGDFSLEINTTATSKITGVLGASGSGKSLFLKCLSGVQTPDEGEIVLGDKLIYSSEKGVNLPPQERKIAYLFQSYGLFPNMTAGKNIDICAKNSDIREILRLTRVEKLLAKYPHQLSGGERQRVAIARILASKPDVILLDEPFSALDTALRADIERDMLRAMREYEGLVFIVSHNFGEIYRLSDSISVMAGGRILEQGEKSGIYNNAKCIETVKLMGYENILPITQGEKGEYIGDLNLYTNAPFTSNGYVYFTANDVFLDDNGSCTGEVLEVINDLCGHSIYLKVGNSHIKFTTKDHIEVGKKVNFNIDLTKIKIVR